MRVGYIPAPPVVCKPTDYKGTLTASTRHFSVAHKKRIREETEAIYKRPTSQTTLTNFRLTEVNKHKDSTGN